MPVKEYAPEELVVVVRAPRATVAPLIAAPPTAAATSHGGAADRRAADGRGDGAGDGAAGADGRTRAELEVADAGLVIEPGRDVVLVRVPERAAVGVEGHAAVVAPPLARAAAAAALRARALEHGPLGEGDAIRGVASEAAGILEARIRGRVRCGVADGYV